MDCSPEKQRAEIAWLMSVANEDGEHDGYAGKRGRERVTVWMQLEYALDLAPSAKQWNATMHDVSTGGISFSSRQELDSCAIIYVRAFSDLGPRPWVEARVRHVTGTVQGFLIGAEFTAAEKPQALSPVGAMSTRQSAGGGGDESTDESEGVTRFAFRRI